MTQLSAHPGGTDYDSGGIRDSDLLRDDVKVRHDKMVRRKTMSDECGTMSAWAREQRD